jgi:hypothetical protein
MISRWPAPARQWWMGKCSCLVSERCSVAAEAFDSFFVYDQDVSMHDGLGAARV